MVSGQADANEWSIPLNLSQSGTATRPTVVMDASQQLHVLWQDSLDNFFVYTQGSGDQWSQPIAVELPFGTRAGFPDLSEDDPTPLFTPKLVADASGLIHAFWLGDAGELVYSRVQAETFTDFTTWTPRQILAADVVGTAVMVGVNGRFHLTYITTVNRPESPAGLYYRQSDDGGNSWSEPVQLYQSSYFRLLTPDNVQLQMSQDAQIIYVGWDERPRERVFLVRSVDDGANWEMANEIDRRQEGDSLESVGPSNLQIGTQGGQVHLTWQAGHEGISCVQYHQWSGDGGSTWQTSEPLLTAFTICPESTQFLASATNLFLLAQVDANTYLLVWDGDKWLAPQLQPELTDFIDADVFRQVDYTCGQTAFVDGEQLFVLSCGAGMGQDIWLITRSLTTLVEAVRMTPVWSTPAPLPGEAQLILSPALVADQENYLHMFWRQAEATAQSITNENTFYYARWNGIDWTRPTGVLSSPHGEADYLSLAIDHSDNLLAAWSSGTTGEIYFSRVTADQALIASAWSSPVSLPVPRMAAAAPSLVVEANGMIHVAYTLPFNEDRGVYIVTSEDGGSSWSEPNQVFDGVEAGWESLDQPKLTVTDEAKWHLLWLRRPLGKAQATLYYAYSHDKGQSWSEPEQVHSTSQQTASVIWYQIVGVGDRTIHRSWQEQGNGRSSLWHQQSLDNGLSWSSANRLFEGTAVASAQMTLDIIGEVYLIAAVQASEAVNGSDVPTLQQWLWQDERWQPEQVLDLRSLPAMRTDLLAATTTGDGRLAVAYVAQAEDEASPELLFFTNRTLALPEVTATPLPTLTPTPSPTSTAMPTSTPEPTAAVEFPTQATSDGFSLPFIGTVSGNGIVIVGAMLAIIPVGLVTVLVLVLRTRSNR